ncbi:class Ib ribonucleoside-diphosphate reductase assembly flavoprotein NrdI [Nicoliella lavandulae]|uniref:Class Ib ribonucleoside-diphosphate reductase assembly flavoprotein NrdI n=1 Tax=Nicoliella lavandulae TaxID=3082954 RepID=A0ABU8SJG6_9LACO
MNDHINILYVSLSGNTKAFIQKLTTELAKQSIIVNSINVRERPTQKKLLEPFVTFLPAFLKGGNGIDNGFKEILTTPLRRYLEFADNYKQCYGIIGSGNRNFNKQFALTAKQYANDFGFPYLTDFELKGSKSDVTKISALLIKKQSENSLAIEGSADTNA